MTKTQTVSVRTFAIALALSVSALFAFVQFANAAGGDSDPPKSCPSGYVWSNSKGKCVRINSSVDDEELYDQGEKLALHGYYERAIEVLKASSNQNDPRVLNYIGYSFRKLGQLDTGIRYYAKALAIDPNYVRAREYLGEGYVAAGKLAEAEGQLVEIEKRCGTGCEEYQLLAQVITAAGGDVRIN